MSAFKEQEDRIRISAVILAAGNSSRMGRPKQLLAVNGVSMLGHTILTAREAGYSRPVLVLGAHADEIQQKEQLTTLCKTIVNPDFTTGQSSSLKAGVQQIIGTCEAALFMLCDQPFLHQREVNELTERFISTQPDLLYPTYRGKRGNPVFISSTLFPKLLQARGDSGARFLFEESNLKIVGHEVDAPGILIDIDTPEEYERHLHRNA